MSRRQALEEFFLDAFTPQELRLFLGREPESGDLMASLPIESSDLTPAIMASKSVEALTRRGLLDRAFFDRLQSARPARETKIREVRRQWLRGNELDTGALWGDGRYELIAHWGSGGIGTVWKAKDTKLQCHVAIKIFNDQIVDDRRLRARYFRGMNVLARLKHPAIVGVRAEIEQEGSHYFYVMEFLEGASLESLLGGPSKQAMLEYVLSIGDALACVHSNNLFHRDIKPGNIIVTQGGRAVLIDFDLVTGDEFLPLTTAFPTGTPGYSAPEASTTRVVTAAYDVYGLARTAEDVLRGRLPTPQEFLNLNRLNTLDIPKSLRSVLRSALNPIPVERTQSIKEFCDQLRAALNEENTEPLPRWGWPLLLAASGLIAGSVLYVIWSSIGDTLPPQTSPLPMRVSDPDPGVPAPSLPLPFASVITHESSCPEKMIYVPSGVVDNKITPGFCLDVYEVTVDDFGRYLKESKYSQTKLTALKSSLGTVSFRDKPYKNREDNPSERRAQKEEYSRNCTWRRQGELAYHPINCITHTEAKAFCEFYGKRLPDQSEWQWAAGGASNRFTYPWGTGSESLTRGNLAKINGDGSVDLTGEPVQVGMFPPTKLGFHDLEGNVSEWVTCEQSLASCRSVGGNFRIAYNNLYVLNVKFINPGSIPGLRSDGVGFRCLQAPKRST